MQQNMQLLVYSIEPNQWQPLNRTSPLPAPSNHPFLKQFLEPFWKMRCCGHLHTTQSRQLFYIATREQSNMSTKKSITQIGSQNQSGIHKCSAFKHYTAKHVLQSQTSKLVLRTNLESTSICGCSNHKLQLAPRCQIIQA